MNTAQDKGIGIGRGWLRCRCRLRHEHVVIVIGIRPNGFGRRGRGCNGIRCWPVVLDQGGKDGLIPMIQVEVNTHFLIERDKFIPPQSIRGNML